MKNSRNNLATPLEKEAEIMSYFLKEKNNSISEIAEHFKMSKNTIHAIIDGNLNPKNNGFKSGKKK